MIIDSDLGPNSRMILTFNPLIISSLIKLNVVSGHRLQYFVKNPFFHVVFFLQKSLSYKISHKIGQNHSGPSFEQIMMDILLQHYIPSLVEIGLGSREEDFKGFLPYMCMAAIFVM